MTEQKKKSKELIDKFKEEIEKEANEYAYAFGNGIFNDGLYRGFVDSFNSKISERIKIDFAISMLDEIWIKANTSEYMISRYIQNKITELKNSIK